MATGLVWHERMMRHDTGSGAAELPSGGWLEPHVHVESPDTKRRLKNLLDAAVRLCDGRLVAVHEGGYSAGHVPFCGVPRVPS